MKSLAEELKNMKELIKKSEIDYKARLKHSEETNDKWICMPLLIFS
jgi:hypothetical protein